jgi:2-dehydro-3-deoxy-D-arabinonate dehydratase
MRLGQIRLDGVAVAAVFEGGMARPIPNYTVIELIQRSEAEHIPLAEMAARLASRHPEEYAPVLPLSPPEVWGCGFADDREARPAIFFKGTARVCVGPGQAIGIRADSRFTAPGPALAVVLGSRGHILGYLPGNDVSAWDIERENALYLPQSKIYNGSCALGPVILTADEPIDPYQLEMSCTIMRDDAELFSGAASTAPLIRRIETLVEFLMRSNNVPAGSVLLAGTGIAAPREAALAPGDVVAIRVAGFGELANRAALVE